MTSIVLGEFVTGCIAKHDLTDGASMRPFEDKVRGSSLY